MGMLASPLGTIEVSGAQQGREQVCRWIEQYGVAQLIVGLPLLLDGSEGEEARYVRAWVEQLQQQLDLPVNFWDERLSSAAAERALLEEGMRRERRRQHRDAVAAALILQSFLDARSSWHRSGGKPAPEG